VTLESLWLTIYGIGHRSFVMTHLDEWASEQEAVRKADLYAAKQRRHASPVDWEVGKEVCDDRCGGHRGLQHANERIAVDGLDHLLLHRFQTERDKKEASVQ
jgi:hypothetical protein